MKRACYAALVLLVCAFPANRAGGDPYSPQNDPEVNPHALEDPDGVPLSVTAPRQSQSPQSETAGGQNQEAQDPHWFLHEYQRQLKMRMGSTDGGKSTDIPYHTGSDKDFAPAPSAEGMTPRTDAPQSKEALTLRTDAQDLTPSTTHISLFEPLITPLSDLSAVSQHNSYSFLPTDSSLTPPASKIPQSVVTATEVDPKLDPAALETPGLTAAESNPLDTTASNLQLSMPDEDALPQDSSGTQSSDKLELPLATNEARLQKQDDAALNVPGMVKPQAKPVNPALLLLKAPDDPKPDTSTQPSPVRQPIADPFDFYRR